MNTGKWVLGTVLMVAVLSFSLGTDLKESEWISTPIAYADAGRIRSQTDAQRRMDAQDYRVYVMETELTLQELRLQQKINQVRYEKILEAVELGLPYEHLLQPAAREQQPVQDEGTFQIQQQQALMADALVFAATLVALGCVLVLVCALAYRIAAAPARTQYVWQVRKPQTSKRKPSEAARKAREKARALELYLRKRELETVASNGRVKANVFVN